MNAKVLEIAQAKVVMYDADASEMEQIAADEVYLQRHRRSFGSRPVRVLTSGNHGVGHLERKPPDTPEHLKYERETTLAQARWLALSSNSKQILAHNSSEYIQFDEPDTVINALRDVYDETERKLAGKNVRVDQRGPEATCAAGQLVFNKWHRLYLPDPHPLRRRQIKLLSRLYIKRRVPRINVARGVGPVLRR
ncbi:MAG: hypothetical protein WBZ11_20085 [Candidatus Sulfotelmatobacter sp.]